MPAEIAPSSSNPAFATYDSPIGRLTLAARSGSLVGVQVVGQRLFGRFYGINEVVAPSSVDLTSPDFRGSVHAEAGWDEADVRVLRAATSWLDNYFAGEAPSPTAVHPAPTGTDFQKRVWEETATIPYGVTRTHGRIVDQLRGAGIPTSTQAVGGAVGRNPLPLVLPCHRVVAVSDPGGYAAGEHARAWLLAHETATASPVS